MLTAPEKDRSRGWKIQQVRPGIEWALYLLSHHLLATESLNKGTTPEGKSEAIEKLNPLKVMLEAIPGIFADHQVRPCPPAWSSPLTTNLQETVAAKNRIDILLLRIVALEEDFDSCPSGVMELRRRDELILYAVVPQPSCQVLISCQ